MYDSLQKKQYSVSPGNEKTDKRMCKMVRPLCNDVRVSHHSVGAKGCEKSMPIQRKLIFKGQEQKNSNVFFTEYEKHKDYYDLYTDDSNSKQSLDIGHKQYQQHTGVTDHSLEAFIQWLIDDVDYYYIGVKKDIINTLVDIYHKIEPFSGIHSDIKDREHSIIIMALNRMYKQGNSDALDAEKNAKDYSAYLIGLVEKKIKTATPLKKEFELFDGKDTTDISNNKNVQSEPTDKKKGAIKEFHLKKGNYIYRTVSKAELDKLLAVSDKTGNTYTVSEDKRRDKPELNPIIGGHAGNLTQAVTYEGFLIEFKMKESFFSHVMDTIAFQGEGTTNNAGGKIGMKSENEGMLASGHRKSFSFYTKPTNASNTFLSDVESFRILYLGKAEGS